MEFDHWRQASSLVSSFWSMMACSCASAAGPVQLAGGLELGGKVEAGQLPDALEEIFVFRAWHGGGVFFW